MASIRPGIYRHYKGSEYRVYGLARHSETEEELVIYRCLYDDYSLWVRPLSLFNETVTREDGSTTTRFAFVRDAEDELHGTL